MKIAYKIKWMMNSSFNEALNFDQIWGSEFDSNQFKFQNLTDCMVVLWETIVKIQRRKMILIQPYVKR